MNDHAILLRADDISVPLAGRKIVERARVKLRRGELAIMVGPNGAGKTTLVRALAGLIPYEGSVVLHDRPLASYSPGDRAKRIAYLPQGNVFHWPMPVEAIVALGRYPHADAFAEPTEADRDAVRDAMAATAIGNLAGRIVTTLSGGERARVALARALATKASVILADEPIVSLDPRHQFVVMDLLQKAARDGGAVLAVMHDLSLAARFADHVLVMQGGRLVTQGDPKDALHPKRLAEVFGVDATLVALGDQSIPVVRKAL